MVVVNDKILEELGSILKEVEAARVGKDNDNGMLNLWLVAYIASRVTVFLQHCMLLCKLNAA